VELARRLVDEAGVAGISFHPRHASQQHKGEPDYALAAELVEHLDVPVIVSGGLSSDERALAAFERTGADAVMLARGSLGNPWRFERLLGLRDGEPARGEVVDELRWVIACAEEHLGTERAGRYLRKFYPWYAETLGLSKRAAQPLLTAPDTAAARAIGGIGPLLHSRAFQRLDRRFHMAKDVILTPQGLEDLKEKIEYLSSERRREVAERIKEAREFGDISENSEYDDAKNEQAMLERQIAELEDKLRSAQVIDETAVTNEVVSVGVTVHVKDQKTDKSVKYKIVGSAEANPSENKLSNESPVGKALLGKKRGELVSVPVPRGPARKLKITKIEAK
jgi:transcription elongation factor GreA